MVKKRIIFAAAIVAVACAFWFLVADTQAPAATPGASVALNGRMVEPIGGGKPVDLGNLSRGKPFYVVFSTPT